MSNKSNSLTVKDLVTIGIFSALFLILSLIGGAVLGSNPVTTFWMPLGGALLPGPALLLLIAKVPKHGPIIILGVICAIIYFATGMHWTMPIAYLVCGVLADLISSAGKFKNVWLNIISYMIFALSLVPTYFMFFFARESYMSYMLQKGTKQEYLDAMVKAGQDWVLPVMIIGTLAVAFLSGLFGKKLLKKQFEKAGITA